jgi:osmotically inducible protein OsmC
MIRKSTAVWNGSGKEGKGNLTTQSGVLNQTQYGFKSRFEDGIGTNPEELVAAAHAGCFSMKLAFNLQAEGITPDEIKCDCSIVLEDGSIVASKLTVAVAAKGLSQEKFESLVKDAELNCPISKLFNTEIIVESALIS